MMTIFIDTEFTDFKDCDLISLGIVSEDGKHEFYVEISDHCRDWQSDFVKANIVPLLDMKKFGMPYLEACESLKQWIDELPTDDITVVVDYTGDWQLMSDMLNTKLPVKTITAQMLSDAFTQALLERGHHVPVIPHAISMMAKGIEKYYDIDGRIHHALVDAKSNRHGWITGIKAIS